jgi:6-phosphogluconolactonase
MSARTPAAALAEHRFDDPAASAAALALDVAAALRAGLEARGQASLVLSGGKSPVPFLRALAQQPLHWPAVQVTLADERWVDPGSSDSNEHLLRETLLRGAAAAARFIPLKSAEATAAEALAGRSAALAAMPRPFDAVVLGMGDDGHTASLFPGAAGTLEALDPDGQPQLAAITSPAAPHPRISLTLAALLDTRGIYLQIQGAAKLAVYERALSGEDGAGLPIAAVLRQRRVAVQVYLVA